MINWISQHFIGNRSKKIINKQGSYKDPSLFLSKKFNEMSSNEKNDYLKTIIIKKNTKSFAEIIPFLNKKQKINNFNKLEDIYFFALNQGAYSIAELILKHNLNEDKDLFGETILLKTIRLPITYQAINLLKIVMNKYPLQLNTCDKKNNYPLRELLDKGDFLLIEKALDLGAKPEIVPQLINILDDKNYKIYKKILFDNNVAKNYSFLGIDENCNYSSNELIFSTNEKTIKDAFSLKNKKIIKELESFKLTNNTVNSKLFNYLFLIKKSFPLIDENLLIPLIKNYNYENCLRINEVSIPLIIDFMRLFKDNVKRLISLLKNTDDFEIFNLINCTKMYAGLSELNKAHVNKIIMQKPKSFKQINTNLSSFVRKIEQEDFLLNQEKIMHLDNTYFQNFQIIVPKKSHDLIHLGKKLNICVGDGFYSMMINSSETYIIELRVDKKTVGCVEFNTLKINQAKYKNNENMNESLIKNLQKFIQNEVLF